MDIHKSSRAIAAAMINLVLLAPFAACADAQSDFATVIRNFHAAKSFHSEADNGKGEKLIVDYVAPDRFRTIVPDGTESIMIGTDIWIKFDGKNMKVPAGAGGKKRSLAEFTLFGLSTEEFARSYDVADTGTESLAGVATHTYRIIKRGESIPIKVWVGADALPVQLYGSVRGESETVRYAQFNAPMTIVAP